MPTSTLDPNAPGDLTHREQVISIVRRGLTSFDEPVQLASGAWSKDFIDGKLALSTGDDLEIACLAVLEAVGEVEFDAVGGLTMGADMLAHGVALTARPRRKWFSVRKEAKRRGTNKIIEGAEVAGLRVLLVDDVVTAGGSIRQAYEDIEEAGGIVVAAVTLVDRADTAGQFFGDRAVPYIPLVRSEDLGIERVNLAASLSA